MAFVSMHAFTLFCSCIPYKMLNVSFSLLLCIKQEISDYLTEPFRNRAPGSNGTSTGGPPVTAALQSAPVNNGSNTTEGIGRSLDALSLNAPTSVAANSSQDPSFPHLKEKPWFYGAITRAECDNLLNQYGQDGDFLVRSSETNVSLTQKLFFLVLY